MGAAVEAASAALGLPSRFLLRVNPDLQNPLLFDDADYLASVQKEVKASGGLQKGEYGTSLFNEEEEEVRV